MATVSFEIPPEDRDRVFQVQGRIGMKLGCMVSLPSDGSRATLTFRGDAPPRVEEKFFEILKTA